MLVFLVLTALLCEQIYCFLYPNEYDIIVNIIKNKINNTLNGLQHQCVYLGYNVLYFYSLVHINVNKIIRLFSPYISVVYIALINVLTENKLLDKPQRVITISIYKDGQIVNNINVNKNDKHIYDLQTNTIGEPINNYNYDFVIVTDNPKQTEYVNKIHYTQIPNLFDDYKHSNIKFLSVELTYNNTTHTINLKNEKENYYIVDNVFNANFFKYYLINVLNVEIDANQFDYKVSVIDHNVNMVELTSNDYLIMNENDYNIYNTNELNTLDNDINNKLTSNVEPPLIDTTIELELNLETGSNANNTSDNREVELESNTSDISDEYVTLDCTK